MLLFPITSIAQHPVEIQKKTAEGDHYRALVDFEKEQEANRAIKEVIVAHLFYSLMEHALGITLNK